MVDPSPRFGRFGQAVVPGRCGDPPTAESEPAPQADGVQIHDHVNIIERPHPGNAPYQSEDMEDLNL